MARRQAHSGSRRDFGAWRLFLFVTLVLVLAAAQLRSQERTPGRGISSRPLRPTPRLLSKEEVDDGLRRRFSEMRERQAAYVERRRQQPPRDYLIPEPPADAPVPPRPDAQDGEITLERARQRGGR